jgi:hypothetical protein
MKLIKLLAVAALGYLIYEFFQGLMADPSEASWQRNEASSRDLHRALNEDPGRMNITGEGRGTTVSTQDFAGGSTRHVVGRGVVHR